MFHVETLTPGGWQSPPGCRMIESWLTAWGMAGGLWAGGEQEVRVVQTPAYGQADEVLAELHRRPNRQSA